MNATIEDEVRTMLVRRAADVPDDGAAARLPTGLRIAVDEDLPADGGRGRWLATAAAVVLVLGAAALVVRTVDVDTGTTGATDHTTAPVASPRPGHLTLLPAGVDPTVGAVRGLGRPAPTPEAASDAFMADAFGEDVSPNDRFEWGPDADADEIWGAYRVPRVALDPEAWPGFDRDGAPASVTARRTEAGWYVVAATSAALDLRGVRHEGGYLSGEVRATSSAPLRVTISTVLGEELAKSDLTTSTLTGERLSVLSLDDIEADLGGQPVVLRVEAGDRPGQIDIDGVRVAAVSSVILPAPTGAEATATTTTAEPDPTPTTATESDLPLDGPLAAAVDAALPLEAEVVSVTAVGPSDGRDEVVVTGVVGEESFEVTVYRRVPTDDLATLRRVEVPWGTAWLDVDEPTVRAVVGQGADGVTVRFAHVAPSGNLAPVERMLGVVEGLVADVVVAGVAAGGDPNG